MQYECAKTKWAKTGNSQLCTRQQAEATLAKDLQSGQKDRKRKGHWIAADSNVLCVLELDAVWKI